MHRIELGGQQYRWREYVDNAHYAGMLKSMPQIDINALPADVESLRAIIVANQLEHTKSLKKERAKVSALEQHITILEH